MNYLIFSLIILGQLWRNWFRFSFILSYLLFIFLFFNNSHLIGDGVGGWNPLWGSYDETDIDMQHTAARESEEESLGMFYFMFLLSCSLVILLFFNFYFILFLFMLFSFYIRSIIVFMVSLSIFLQFYILSYFCYFLWLYFVSLYSFIYILSICKRTWESNLTFVL